LLISEAEKAEEPEVGLAKAKIAMRGRRPEPFSLVPPIFVMALPPSVAVEPEVLVELADAA